MRVGRFAFERDGASSPRASTFNTIERRSAAAVAGYAAWRSSSVPVTVYEDVARLGCLRGVGWAPSRPARNMLGGVKRLADVDLRLWVGHGESHPRGGALGD
jgi:hypothetical protein